MTFQLKNLTKAMLAGLCLSLGSNAFAQWATEPAQENSSEKQTPTDAEQENSPGTRSEQTISTDTKTTRKITRSKPKSKIEEMGTSLIFSADIGLLGGFPSTKLTGYQSKTGLALEGKALGSILLNNFLIDAGIGWFFYNVSGIEPVYIDGQPVVSESGEAVTDNLGIKLSGSILEFSPSYRIKNSYFAGPTLQLRYPSDLGYDSRIARKAMGLYVGAQGGYQLFDEDLNTRFVGRLMMPMNYKDWLGIQIMAGVQIGLPFSQPETLIIEESTLKTSEKKIVEYRKQVFKFKVTRDVVKLVLDNLVVFYPEPGYPTLTTEAQSFLIDLSQSLSEIENNWGTLQVDTVSRPHAQVIRDALVSAGVSEKKIRLGPPIPGDKTSATPPVEFTFKGTKNQVQMMDAVRRAMKAMSIPETCENGVCQ